jgi:hypothetical protein
MNIVNLFKFFLIGAVFLTFTGCEPKPQSIDSIVFNNHELSGCVIDAALYRAIYKQNNSLKKYYWSKILMIKFKGSNDGHATCVYMINIKDNENPLDNIVFSYDFHKGSRMVPLILRNNPLGIARYLYGDKVELAIFL